MSSSPASSSPTSSRFATKLARREMSNLPQACHPFSLEFPRSIASGRQRSREDRPGPDYLRPDSREDRIMVRRNQRTSCDCGGLAATNWARDQLQQVSPDDVDRIHNWPNRYRRQNGKENGFYCLKTDIFSPEIMPADIADGATSSCLSDPTNNNDICRVHDEETRRRLSRCHVTKPLKPGDDRATIRKIMNV
jgi:hypothetical protein